MASKVYDRQGRWRNKTVTFRMSPEEVGQLDVLSRLSGLTKQDYLVQRALDKEITVLPSSRVYKALRNRLADVLAELRRLDTTFPDDGELVDLIYYITNLLGNMKGENEDGIKE